MAGVENQKLVVVGDGAVGKTCLLQRYTTNSFDPGYVPTVFENLQHQEIVDGQSVSLEIVDTAGQEGYDSLRPVSYPDTKVFLICFALDSPDSLSNVEQKWLPELKHYLEEMPPFIIVGNKSDKLSEPQVRGLGLVDQANSMAQRLGAHGGRCFQCSALAGEGVEAIFKDAVRAVQKAARGENGGCCSIS